MIILSELGKSLRKGSSFIVQDIYVPCWVGELADYQKERESGDRCLCGDRDGKHFMLQENCGEQEVVEARDLSLYKVGLITENIERSGLMNIHAVQKDATVCDSGCKKMRRIL